MDKSLAQPLSYGKEIMRKTGVYNFKAKEGDVSSKLEVTISKNYKLWDSFFHIVKPLLFVAPMCLYYALKYRLATAGSDNLNIAISIICGFFFYTL